MTRNAVKAKEEAAKQNTDKSLARRDLFRVAGLGVGALGAVAAFMPGSDAVENGIGAAY